MKRRVLAFLLLLPFVAAAQTKGSMEQSLDVLLKDELFETGDVSLAVYDLTAGELLYSHREKKTLRPASVQKVLTAVAALEKLGSSYTVETELFERKTGACRNLYVKGCMDPLFSDADMKRMVLSVPAGMVVDTLFADCSFTDSLYWGSGWVWDDNPYGFQPYLSPLMVCGGAVDVEVWPLARGEAPGYKVTPESSFYSVVNEAESNNPEMGKLTILRDWLVDSNVIRIRGNCKSRYKESINMYRSADFFVAMLAEMLAGQGVEVRNVAFSAVPRGATRVHSCKRYLTDIVDEALMESDNLCAEALVYHLAAIDNRPPLSLEEGCSVLQDFLSVTLGVEEGFMVHDGSGLSIYDYTSAAAILEVLKHAYGSKEYFDAFYSSLPLSGVSGTMQHRTKGSAAYKKVRAKTGTVKGFCTLAGYAQAADGHLYAFVIFNSGLQKPAEIRLWQDKVLDALCR